MRGFRSTAVVKEEAKGQGGPDFRGQLYESTAQRLQRERTEQARFAKERGESSGGRNTAITFGESLSTMEGKR